MGDGREGAEGKRALNTFALLIVVMASQAYTDVKFDQIVHCECVWLILCQLLLDKAV